MQIKLPREQVDVSDYTDEGPITVRAMTAAEESELYRMTQKDSSEESANMTLVAKVAIDDEGQPLFTRQQVQELPGALVRQLAEVSLRLSGMLESDEGDEGKN